MFKYLLSALVLLTQSSLFAADVSQGETLEKQTWEYIKKHQWSDLEKRIAPYFQLAQFDEVLNHEQYLNHAKALNIGDYTMSDFKVTEGLGTIVVTYEIAVSETLGGKTLSSKANRLSVWQKNNDNWQMIAHAILIPVPPQAAKK